MTKQSGHSRKGEKPDTVGADVIPDESVLERELGSMPCTKALILGKLSVPLPQFGTYVPDYEARFIVMLVLKESNSELFKKLYGDREPVYRFPGRAK